MIPTGFDEENGVLGRPIGMTDEQCLPLSICRTYLHDGLPCIISCWKMTADELAEINRTGRVWLGIVGPSMPPAFLAGISPFNQDATPIDGATE